jgi:hypothetical protein
MTILVWNIVFCISGILFVIGSIQWSFWFNLVIMSGFLGYVYVSKDVRLLGKH